MSIIHQLFRIKIDCNIPIEVEEILIIYINALQGKDKINNLFNIVGKVPRHIRPDFTYPDYTVMNVKELRAEMVGLLRPCDINGTGKNGGIKKIDMIDALNNKHIADRQKINFIDLQKDYIYSGKWFIKDKKLYNTRMLDKANRKNTRMLDETELNKYDKEIQEVKCLFDKLQQNSKFSPDLKRDMKRNCNITIKDIKRGGEHDIIEQMRDFRNTFKTVTKKFTYLSDDISQYRRNGHPSIYLEYNDKGVKRLLR